MIVVLVPLAVALLTFVYLMALVAAEGFHGGLRLLPLAGTITALTSAITTATYLLAPVLWVLVWMGILWLVLPLVALQLRRTYPRREIRTLLTERLTSVLGADWNKHLTIEFTPANRGTKVITNLPAATIPSEIAPKLKSVVGETLGGAWSLSTKGTQATVTRIVVKPEPKYLRNLKEVVLAPKAFTAQATISDDQLGEDGAIRSFTVTYAANIATDIALGSRSKSIEKQIRASLPAGSGSWSFNWDVPQKKCVITRSMFQRRIPHQLTTTPVRSIKEAADLYPDLAIGLGIDEFGELVAWKLDGDSTPHGIVFGTTGGGKSSTIATIITEAAPAGACIIIVDFKGDAEYDRFRTWPGVHLVAQDFYSCLRAIAYGEELMNLRKRGGKAPSTAPDPKVPIIMIIDEFAAGAEEIRSQWPRLRGDNAALPKEPPTIASARQIMRKGRSLRNHVFNATQRATADNFPAELKHLCPMKIQAGQCDGTTSQNFWDNFEIGQTLPAKTPGRCLTPDADAPNGFVQFQGFFTPNPTDRELADDEAAILEALRPEVSLYPRMVIDMLDADKIHSWHQIATAPIVPAESRPDLDPEKPEEYRPRVVYQIDTVSNVIDASTMQLKGSPAAVAALAEAAAIDADETDDDTDDPEADNESEDVLPQDSAPEDNDNTENPAKRAPSPRKSTRKSGPPKLTLVRSIQGEQQQPRKR
ncbi:helicase HerA domain-containing protein [Mycobacteroides abscessus]|uniref:helicase HerA domain-containing protein n=1 Tax=Mycobacteroides abscessus TaxID=36809 RepID=UPI002105C746|nr:DUF87 domain-containing protein [Mycobacteroides abscessus]